MDPKRLRFAITGVVGFFGFIGTFLFIASALGGDPIVVGLSIIAGIVFGGGCYVLYPYFTGNVQKPIGVPTVGKLSLPKLSYKPVCQKGPYDVEPGTPTRVLLDVRASDKVFGDVTEIESADFDCYIADSDEFVKYLNHERGFRPIFKGKSKGAHSVNVVIPFDGQWYLLLDAPGRKLTREVEANLKCSTQSIS